MFKHHPIVLTALALAAATAHAQGAIYRCGNEYTNSPTDAQKKNCKLVEGGNITIIQGGKPATPAGTPAGAAAPAARNGNERVDNTVQRSRDAEARQILENELRKTEARLAEMRAEYNNGEPEKRGPEFRNHQLYLDRVEQLKTGIERAQNDVNGIRRELSRLPAPAPAAQR